MNSKHIGIMAALGAYFLWGLLPVYFKLIQHVSAFEILAHRVVWSILFLLIIIAYSKSWKKLRDVLRDSSALAILTATALLIATNWVVFIWAVNDGRILETSLGYYINPIINMFLAMIFLGERLRSVQWVALICAALGVAIQISDVGYLPWVALTLAFSFGGYGILKKKKPIDPTVGLFVETLLMLPFAIAYLIYLSVSGNMMFLEDTQASLLLPLAGVLTAVPLLLYTAAAHRMPITLLSFFQYVAPSITFTLATLFYKEPLTTPMLMTFACIWTGLILYSLDSIKKRSQKLRSNRN